MDRLAIHPSPGARIVAVSIGDGLGDQLDEVCRCVKGGGVSRPLTSGVAPNGRELVAGRTRSEPGAAASTTQVSRVPSARRRTSLPTTRRSAGQVRFDPGPVTSHHAAVFSVLADLVWVGLWLGKEMITKTRYPTGSAKSTQRERDSRPGSQAKSRPSGRRRFEPGQADPEGCAPTFLADDRDRTAVRLDDGLDDRESKPGATVVPGSVTLERREALEDPR